MRVNFPVHQPRSSSRISSLAALASTWMIVDTGRRWQGAPPERGHLWTDDAYSILPVLK